MTAIVWAYFFVGTTLIFLITWTVSSFAVDRLERQLKSLRADFLALDGRRAALVSQNIRLTLAVSALKSELHGFRTRATSTSSKSSNATSWRSTFGFNSDDKVSRRQIDAMYGKLAKVWHPDVSGLSDFKMKELNAARDAAYREVK